MNTLAVLLHLRELSEVASLRVRIDLGHRGEGVAVCERPVMAWVPGKKCAPDVMFSLAANTPVRLGIGKQSVTVKPSGKFPMFRQRFEHRLGSLQGRRGSQILDP